MSDVPHDRSRKGRKNKTMLERAQFGEVKGTKKVLAGLDWLLELGDQPADLSALTLRQNICNESTPAGKLLRSCLTETGNYMAGVKARTYVVNAVRLIDLRQKFGLDPAFPSVLTSARTKLRYLASVKLNPFAAGIPRDAGKRVGHRYYTAITSMEEEVRTALIGHGFDYDITASMATLLYQRYLKACEAIKAEWGLDGVQLPTWQSLVTDRTKFRQELADFTGMPLPKVKTIIASVLNGAQLVAHRENSTFQIFRVAHANCTWDEFVNHPLMLGLVTEGRVLYDTICPKDERTRETKVYKTGAKAGHEYSRAKSRGHHQFRLYEEIEDEVMTVVSVVLSEQDVWYIHDGFMCREQISREKFTALISRVKELTGYEIDLEETVLDANEGDEGDEGEVK